MNKFRTSNFSDPGRFFHGCGWIWLEPSYQNSHVMLRKQLIFNWTISNSLCLGKSLFLLAGKQTWLCAPPGLEPLHLQGMDGKVSSFGGWSIPISVVDCAKCLRRQVNTLQNNSTDPFGDHCLPYKTLANNIYKNIQFQIERVIYYGSIIHDESSYTNLV